MRSDSESGEPAAALSPVDMRVRLRELRDQGRYDQILADAGKWCSANPFDFEVGLLSAEAAQSINDHMRAIEYFRSLVRMRPLNLNLRGHYTIHLIKANKAKEGFDELKRILIISPTETMHIANFASLMRAVGNLDRAKRFYGWWRSIDPADPKLQWVAEKVSFKEDIIGKIATESRKGLERPQFYRAEQTRFFPRRNEEFDDLDTIMARDIFATYIPEKPVFRSSDTVIAFGSCFAGRIRRWLIEAGRLSRQIEVPEGLNNSFAIRQFFEWTLTGDRSMQDYWIDKNEDGSLVQRGVDEERETFRVPMTNAGGLVLTYGLSEVWRDKRTGGVFWRGIPEARYMPDRHTFEVSSVQDNVENIRRVIDLVRTHCGDIPIVLTLSPVPLSATMRENSIFASDCESLIRN